MYTNKPPFIYAIVKHFLYISLKTRRNLKRTVVTELVIQFRNTVAHTKRVDALAHGEVGLKSITKFLSKYKLESMLKKLFKKVNFQINTLLILK